jgi:hypothetical protein
MAKANLMNLPRQERKTYTRTFADPEVPGVVVELVLHKARASEKMLSLDEATALYSDFSDGLPLANGDVVPMSEVLCQSACLLATMQCGPEEDRYTSKEMVAFLHSMPTAGMDALTWMGTIENGEQTPEGNSKGAGAKS